MMRKYRYAWLSLIFWLLVCPSLSSDISKDKKAKPPCSKPPESIPGPKPSKEKQKKMRNMRYQGLIAAEVSESGDVVDAKVVHASSEEAAKFLVEHVSSMKFKPRPGCGLFKIQMNFTLSER